MTFANRRATHAAYAIVGLLASRSLPAQQVRGVVRDSVSGQPIAGAVVMLADSADAVLGRTITDAMGRFALKRQATTRWLRALRIGFQPREIQFAGGALDSANADFALVRFSIALESVRIPDKSRCRARSDGALTASFWSQARAGLLATILARETTPATIHRLIFERTLDGNSARIVRFLVSADSAVGTTESFTASRSALEFVNLGFTSERAGVQTVLGPSAAVLLDGAFADRYCFRLAEAVRNRPRQVGLAFLPASRSKGRIDIDGTLWIDTAARALVDLEFRYLGFPARAEEFHPGGRISFRTMSNGVALIDRWYLRRVDATQDTFEVRGVLKTRDWLFATESGGELARVDWREGEVWHAPLSALRLRTLRTNGRPATGAVFALPGTPYHGVADSAGFVGIAELLPGPYSLTEIDPRLAEIGITIPTGFAFVAERDSTARGTITVRTASEFIKDKCVAAHQYSVGDSMLVIGRVENALGAPLPNARVSFGIEQIGAEPVVLGGYYVTGTDGAFQLCSHRIDIGSTVVISVHRSDIGTVSVTQKLTSTLTVRRVQTGPP